MNNQPLTTYVLSHLDLVVLSCIQSHLSLPDQATQRSSHHDTSVDSQKRSKYFFHGVRVCRDTFLFVHALSHSRYERLVQHYKHVGLSSRMHGNKGRVPPNTLHFDEVTQLTTFIVNYARAHGMPLPGRVPGHRDKVMVLPSDITKAHVFTKYRDTCSSNGWSAVGRTKFYDVWQNILPHISISNQSSHLCFTCQQNSLALQKSVCLPEEEKSRRLQVAQDHLYRAKTEREYYKAQVDTAVSAWSTSESQKQNPRLCHYSYDFAQQVHYPYDAQQTGPEFFKTARKCGIFGVCNDGNLIDEAENPGKGADCVISLVHHYLGKYGHSEKAVYLHADNCTAQNKNNASIQYLMWRVMTMKNESIELSFMLTRHTKFSPDRFFGLFKEVFRRSSVSTLSDIELAMKRSTKADQNIPQRLHSNGGETLVTFYQWSEHLSQFFRSIPNILSYHSFRVTMPGTRYRVLARVF